LQKQGKLEESAKSFRQATRLDPAFTPAWFALGNVSIVLKDVKTAIDAFERVIRNDPRFFPAYNNLGNIYRESGVLDKAQSMLNKVVELKPDFAEGWYNMGVLHMVAEEGPQAVAALDQAIALQPGYIKAMMNRGRCRQMLLNDTEGALQDIDHVLGISPSSVPALVFKADIFQQLGKYEEAGEILRKALALDDSALAAYYALADSKKYTDDDLQKLQAMLNDKELDIRQLAEMHFILTRIFNDHGDYARAFHHMQLANQMFRSTYVFTLDAVENNYSRMQRVYTADCIRRNAQYGSDSDLPVFIVGMPRSGTTLVEQIISSHPQVFGAGELGYMSKMVINLANQEGTDYHECMAGLPPAEIEKLSSGYLEYIRNLNAAAARITDKMPDNFKHIGPIAMLFPRARIIHCRRHPVDTCLSIYERKFAGFHPYAYDLTELGRYYRLYLQLMAHWEEVLPGRILTVQYEELVGHQEPVSRKLIEFVGLEWDDRCLQFYNKSGQAVKTASHWQVRQQIYSTSKERWRNYEPWLGPLIEALGDAVTDIKM
jgi:tetratricopeptide (TPR) repeat protein